MNNKPLSSLDIDAVSFDVHQEKMHGNPYKKKFYNSRSLIDQVEKVIAKNLRFRILRLIKKLFHR